MKNSKRDFKRLALIVTISGLIGFDARSSSAVGPYIWDGSGNTSNLLENTNWADDLGPEDRRVRAGWNRSSSFADDPANGLYSNNDSAVIFAGTTRLDPYVAAAGWTTDDANPPAANPDAISIVAYNSIIFNNTAGPFVISLGPLNTTGDIRLGPTSMTTTVRTLRNDSPNTQTFNLGVVSSWTDITAATGDFVFNGAYNFAVSSLDRRHRILGSFGAHFNAGITGAGADFVGATTGVGGYLELGGSGRSYITAASASTSLDAAGGLWNGRVRIGGTGSLRISHNNALGAGFAESTTSGRTEIGLAVTNTAALELVNSITTSERIFIMGRSTATDGAAPHIINVSGVNTLTGPIQTTNTANAANTVLAANDDGLGAADLLTIQGNLTQNRAETVAIPNVLTLTGNGAGAIPGNILNGATPATMTWSLQKGGAGTWTLSGTGNNFTGPTTVNAGTLNIAAGSSIDTSNVMTISSGATLIADHVRPATTLQVDGTVELRANGGTAGASKVETFNISAGGKLNLKDNDLVVGTAANFNAVRTAIIAGKTNNAATGITSDITGFGISRGFAYAMGNDPKVSSLLAGSLAGQTFDTDSVLVKFTLLGDADLDGDTDLNDLGLWSNGYTGDLGANPPAPTTFWTGGDFDYDGDTDLNDLGLWSSTYTGDFNGGPGSLVVNAPNASPEAVAILNSMGFTVVPEPSTFVLAGVGLAGLAIAARRRKK